MSDRKKDPENKQVETRVWNRIRWTKKEDEIIQDLYPDANWRTILKALPKRTSKAIELRAWRLRVNRNDNAEKRGDEYIFQRILNDEDSSTVKAKKNEDLKEKKSLTPEQLASYMTRGRSIKEVSAKFKISEKEANALIKNGFDGFDLFVGPYNITSDQTYVAVPKSGILTVAERAWETRLAPNNQPYLAIIFPDDFNHKKLRVIPLDGIHYGNPHHDQNLFKDCIEKISREPNTFCYLNGDIISETRSGRREEREERLIKLSNRFWNLMQPIAHKILWGMGGCIEERAWKNQGFNPLQYFCSRIGAPYFNEPVYADFYWKGRLFTLWSMHGDSTAQLEGTIINSVRRPARVQEYTHFIIRGHIGNARWERTIKNCREPENATIVMREEFHIVLGNFMKYFGTKMARNGHIPSSNDIIVLYLYPNGNHHVKTRRGDGYDK